MDSLITRSFDFPQLPHPIGVAGIAGKPETPVFSCFGNRGKNLAVISIVVKIQLQSS